MMVSRLDEAADPRKPQPDSSVCAEISLAFLPRYVGSYAVRANSTNQVDPILRAKHAVHEIERPTEDSRIARNRVALRAEPIDHTIHPNAKELAHSTDRERDSRINPCLMLLLQFLYRERCPG